MQYICLRIRWNDADVTKAFSNDVSDENVFLLPAATQSQIKSVGLKGCTGPQKFLHFCAYLAKLAYDFAICESDNVSTSPGFEPCLLSFRKNVPVEI